MAIIEAHQKRLAEIDAEIQNIDQEIARFSNQRRANPAGGAAGAAAAARARRQSFTEEREEVAGDIAAILALETSEARKQQRQHARKTVQAALDTAEHRQQLAAALDKAGVAFLTVLDELVGLGAATSAAMREAADLATPFHTHLLGDPWHNGLLNQRCLLIETTYPHATGIEGPDMQHALAFFIQQVLNRLGNPHGVAILAGGWTFDPAQSDLYFQQAAERAHGRLEHNAFRIEYALKEPHELAEIAGGKHG